MTLRPWRRSSYFGPMSRTAAAGPLARKVLSLPAKTRLLLALVAWALTSVLVAVAWLAAPAGAAAYRAVVPHTAGMWGLHLLADVAIMALAGIYAAVMWHVRRANTSLALGLTAGVGVMAAYLASEWLKVLFREERPCRAPSPSKDARPLETGPSRVTTWPSPPAWPWRS
jgi:hypothetical protein